jgi:hypothetical protein
MPNGQLPVNWSWTVRRLALRLPSATGVLVEG